MTKLKWRLGKLPTPEEVLKLVNDKLITKEEAREILFSEEKEIEQSTEDMKTELQFLRKLAEKLASKSQIVETMRIIEKPYYNYGWYYPYAVWAGSGTTCLGTSGTITTNTNFISSGTGTTNYAAASNLSTDINFSEINTF